MVGAAGDRPLGCGLCGFCQPPSPSPSAVRLAELCDGLLESWPWLHVSAASRVSSRERALLAVTPAAGKGQNPVHWEKHLPMGALVLPRRGVRAPARPRHAWRPAAGVRCLLAERARDPQQNGPDKKQTKNKEISLLRTTLCYGNQRAMLVTFTFSVRSARIFGYFCCLKCLDHKKQAPDSPFLV